MEEINGSFGILKKKTRKADTKNRKNEKNSSFGRYKWQRKNNGSKSKAQMNIT